MNLTIHNHRVDHIAYVINGDETFERHLTRFGIHFHDGNVATEGIGKVGRVVEAGEIQAGFQTRRIIVGHVRCERNVAKTNAFIGPLHCPSATRVFEVFLGGFKFMGSNFRSFFQHLIDALHDGATTYRQGTRTISPHPEGNGVGIAMHNVDVLHGNPQPISHDLSKSGLVSLPMRVGPRKHTHFTRGLHAHLRRFVQTSPCAQGTYYSRWRNATSLDISGKTNTQEFAIFAGFGLFFAEILVANHFQTALQHGLVVATIVLQGHLGLVTGLGYPVEGRNKVFEAQFSRIHTHFQGSGIHQALQEISGFWSTCTTVSIHRVGVREHSGDIHMDFGRGV